MHEQLLIVNVKCKMHKNYSLYYKFGTEIFFTIESPVRRVNVMRTVRDIVMLLLLLHCMLLMVP